MFKGKHVRIRPIEETDQEFLVSLSSDVGVRSNVVGWDWPKSVHEQLSWFRETTPRSTQRWIIEDKEDGSQVGLTGLWNIDWHNRHALTAVKIGGASPVRKRGLGTDAIKAVMAFAFYDVGLERLHGAILANNRASLRAYVEKCNWSVEGTLRSHVWRNGQFQDLLQVGILRAEFDLLPDATEYMREIGAF